MRPDPRFRVFGVLVLFGATLLTLSAARAQVIRAVTDTKTDLFEHGPAALDDVGAFVYATSTADPTGANPRHANQIFRWALPNGPAEQITHFADGVGRSVSVSDDGQWLAFVSTSDPLGQNHDESLELFVMRSDGSSLAQLTNDPGPEAGQVFSATIAGSANRVVFLASIDPLGTNPTGERQVFVIDRSGSNLRQLTSVTSGDFSGVSVSDDGARIAFGHSAGFDDLIAIFTVHADGTNLNQVYDGVGTRMPHGPVLSGDGATIAFSDYLDPDFRYRVITWNGQYVTDGLGRDPSLRDDSKVAYVARETSNRYEIYEHDIGQNSVTRLTFSSGSLQNVEPVVSGSGSRLLFRAFGGPIDVGSNPDYGAELMAMDATGSNRRQLTSNVDQGFDYIDPLLSADGSRIAFLSRTHGVGSYPYVQYELERIQSDGTDRQFLIASESDIRWPSMTADGESLVFMNTGNLTGQNPLSNMQGYRIHADGTGLSQIVTSGSDAVYDPIVAADGSLVVFQRTDGSLNRVVPDGSGLALVLDDNAGGVHKYHRVSESGEWMAFESRSNDDGQNPDLGREVFRVRRDGSSLLRVTSDPLHDSRLPDISGDGDRIVYQSTADPLGTNAEHNQEIFSFDVVSGTRRQLTFTTNGSSGAVRISRNGAFAYFQSNPPIFGVAVNPQPERWDLYRVAIETGQIERASGLRDPRTELERVNPASWNAYPAVSADGQQVAFVGAINATDGNPDLNSEIWIADFSQTARVYVGKEAPTLLAWDPDPRAVRYDVIRGDIVNLAFGNGATVDLGAVVCLEDNSPDPHTTGFEDAPQPAPGQTFFYLHRGTQGLADGPGSWGQGTGGRERVVASGSCAD